MSVTRIKIPPKLIPVFQGPADVRGAFGGRGSAKTRSFAKMAAVWGYRFGMEGKKGIILCARQFMNSLNDSSLEEIKRAIEDEPFLQEYYEIGDRFIKSRDGMISFAFAGLDRNTSSVKSKGRILLCWIDEAEPVTAAAFDTLVPTLREEGEDWNAELWLTWNPARKNAAVETRFRNSTDPLVKIVSMNWRDNPKFPAKLERERQRDMIERPDQYEHIWEGAYVSVVAGAYYVKQMLQAREQRRIGNVAADQLMSYHAFCDLGGTGARADAFAMWVVQLIGREIRVLNYYEAVGQELSAHIIWLRDNGYSEKRCQIWLPHDGETNDKVFDVSFASSFRKAGYKVETVPNQGKGAAKQRMESTRRIFPLCWFHEPTTEGGLEALGWYHEKIDPIRNIGLGPNHDWSSHGCDAFGLLAVVYEQQFQKEQNRARQARDDYVSDNHGYDDDWMTA